MIHINARHFDPSYAIDKALQSIAGIDPIVDPNLGAFVGKRTSESNGTEYIFAAGISLENLFVEKKNGICVIYFPSLNEIFVRYFKNHSEAIKYFDSIYDENSNISKTRSRLVEDKFFKFTVTVADVAKVS